MTRKFLKLIRRKPSLEFIVTFVFLKIKFPTRPISGPVSAWEKEVKSRDIICILNQENRFLAGGVYNPEPAVLKQIRNEIRASGEDLLKIIEQKDFRNNFRGLSVEHKLQRVPAGFEKDDPMAEFLKLKSFTVSYPISDETLLDPHAAKNFAKIMKSIKPLNDFLELPFL